MSVFTSWCDTLFVYGFKLCEEKIDFIVPMGTHIVRSITAKQQLKKKHTHTNTFIYESHIAESYLFCAKHSGQQVMQL